MSIASNTIGTARMTLTKNADLYDITVEYRVGSGSFVTGATTTYAPVATSFDQVLVGFGTLGGTYATVEGDIYVDNVLVYTNNDPGSPPEAARIRYEVASGQLALTWPTNAGWRLLGQTNALGFVSGADWFQVGEASDGYYAQPLPSTNAAVFYRLVKP